MRIGIYPGSFDPVTKGHLDLIKRAGKLVDQLIVAVLVNPQKVTGLFSIEERIELLRKVTADLSYVQIDAFDGLLVDYVKLKKADFIIRGVRSPKDCENEMTMAQVNRSLCEEAETIFLVTNPQYGFVSSSTVRELVLFKGNYAAYVPESVAEAIKYKSEG